MGNELVVRKSTFPIAQKMRRAAQYVRMSTERQQYSIQNQAAVIAAYAHTHNLTIVRTYRDEGESGLLIKNRAGLIQLLEDVQAGETDFSHVLVYDVSRWGRFQDVDESAHYEFVCKRSGIKISYCAEQFDNDGSMLASIVKNIKRVMAAEYSRELSAKVYAGQCRYARLGYKPCGKVGYGLVRELVDEKDQSKGIMKSGDRKYLTTDHIRVRPGDAREVAIVRWIFTRFLEVQCETVVAWELNKNAVPTRTGKPWTRVMVGAILRDETYIGNLIFNRRSWKLRQTRTYNPPEEWIRAEGCLEAIVDRDLFQQANRFIDERRVDLSEEEMITRLRRTLLEKGRLSVSIIDRTPGLPCVATCQTHFGSLRNLYRLLGYTPKRNYEFLESRPLWAEQKTMLASRIKSAARRAGCRISTGGWTDSFRVNGSTCVSVRAARWTPRKVETHSPHWTVQCDSHVPAGWIAAIRLSEHNKGVLDYVLLPTDGKVKRTIRFSQSGRERQGIACFKTADGLARAITRRLTMKAPSRSTAEPMSKQPKANQPKSRRGRGRH
ncbi:recombinase family protein [Bradyrhizobium sp. 5.13L]